MSFDNPYVDGNPVGGTNEFIGRQDILRKVDRNLARENANVFVLSGRRRIGKTSILRQLEKNLSDSYIPLYFNLEGKANLPENDVLLELANAIATVIYSYSFPNELVEMLTGDRFTFKKFLDELEDEIEDRSLILLFDEFDAIEKVDDPQQFRQTSHKLFSVLRQLTAFNAEQIQCIFAIGCDVQELDEKNQLSVIKGANNIFVSLLNKSETEKVVRLSEQQGSLNWSDEAVEQVWNLTHGHPYLTQRLCAIIWDNTQNNFSRLTVRLDMVEEAAVEAIQHGQFALQWIWLGLLPAQRVVASAMAEMTNADLNPISQKELNNFLRKNGVGLITPRLEKAADKLVEWDFLVKIKSEGRYKFNIELMRRWLVYHKPLKEALIELERENPAANNFYNKAVESHRQKNLQQAAREAEQAMLLNPNHLTARVFWAQILLDLHRISDAVTQLSMAYDQNRRRAELPYANALLTQAKNKKESLSKRWTASQRSLEVIQKTHSPEVQRLKEAALTVQDELAGEYYQQAKKYEAQKKSDEAISIYKELSEVLPNSETYPWYEDAWQNLIALAKAKQALKKGDIQQAKRLLYSILSQDEEHQEAKNILENIANVEKTTGKKSSPLSGGAVIVVIILIIIAVINGKSIIEFVTQTASVTPPTEVTLTATVTATVTVTPTSTKAIPTVTVTNNSEPTPSSVTKTPPPTPFPKFIELPTLAGHSDAVNSVVFRPDTMQLASAGDDGQIFLWDLAEVKKEPENLADENTEVLGLAFSPDGTRLAYSLSDNTIWLLKINDELYNNNNKIYEFPNRARMAFSHSGLLAVGGGNTLKLWDLANDNHLCDEPKDLKNGLWSLSFSLDGSHLASGHSGEVWLWDVKCERLSEPKVLKHPNKIVNSVVFSPDGNWLASGSEDDLVQVWDIDREKVIHEFNSHTNEVKSVAFSPDGKILASGSLDGTVRLWGVDGGTDGGTELGNPLETGANVWSVAFSPNGDYLAAGLQDGTIRLWEREEP